MATLKTRTNRAGIATWQGKAYLRSRHCCTSRAGTPTRAAPEGSRSCWPRAASSNDGQDWLDGLRHAFSVSDLDLAGLGLLDHGDSDD